MDPAGEKDPVASAAKQFEANGTTEAQGITIPIDSSTSDPEKPAIVPDNSSGSSIDKKDTKIDIPGADEKQEDPLGHLPPDERAVIERQINIPEVSVNFFGLYRFATPMDKFLVVLGTFTAIVAGALLPLMTILFGNLAQAFQDFMLGKTGKDELTSEISKFTL